jgi:hypothetical protein
MTAFYNSPGFSTEQSEYEEIGELKYYRATRKPCPVCGHPTGDCTGESEPLKEIWGYNTGSSFDLNQTFLIQEDFYEQREVGPGLFVKILVYPKGKEIPLLKAKELGFIN